MNILITGASSGLGYALAEQFITQGHKVYSLSRTKPKLNLKWQFSDFLNPGSIKKSIDSLLTGVKLDLAILNAGQLGELKPTSDLDLDDFTKMFNVNVLSNKVIIDYLLQNQSQTKNIIGISTGAAIKPYYGWSLYCTSKSAFKQLISVYAEENPSIQFTSLAPGIIKTSMQEYIKQVNVDEIPSVAKFHNMFDTMDTAEIVAGKIIQNLDTIFTHSSGDFIDLRNII